MKIVVLTGSPHRDGTSNVLAEAFIRGAQEAGHVVRRFDCAFMDVHPCTACNQCRSGGEHPCVFQDDMRPLYDKLIEADAVVYVTPVYYHGPTAQLKTVIDRFYGVNPKICGVRKKAVLLAAAASPHAWVTDGLTALYRTDLRYLGWEDCGTVLAIGCATRQDVERTDYPQQAYELGKAL
ncbi:MAG: flavodoxin family protein [Clostridiales bacterium]|nr:flavodoxin family protein [Clostridiales bacterium]